MRQKKKIGNVDIGYIDEPLDTSYADPAEDELLRIFSSTESNKKRVKSMSNSPSWPLFYHLSPKRGNLVRWYKFNKMASVLEIGAGCGAITEELVKKDIKLTALELTEKRSMINAHRNKNANNLNIVVGNLESYLPSHKYDYIVCVGVLEYAGSFIQNTKPYESFLHKIKSLLSPKGTLLLAIENKMGLKYFAGAREDHTGEYFDGINSYPGEKKVKTFGRIELEQLMSKAGFAKSTFYYPFPDYKLPTLIYSDEYLPGVHCDFPLNLLPVDAPDQPRQHLFSEQSAMINIEANQLYSQFANSFLVESS